MVDVCRCNVPCPCEFAQTPTFDECDGVLAYHIKKGKYGEVLLDELNALALDYFKGNVWAGETKITLAFFFDERANPEQREALQMIFSGRAGGFMAQLANLIGDVRGTEFAPIKFGIADDLSYWSAEIPGKVLAKAEALTGPTTPPGKRVQTINPPGSEVGPGTAGAVATWGKSLVDEADAMGFKWERKGRSSKHIPFEWSGPLSFDMTLQVGICVYTDWQKWLYVIGIFSLGRYFNIYTNPQSGRGYRCDKSLGRQSILEVFAYFFPSFDSSIATLTSLFFLEYGQLSKMSFLFLLGIGKSGLSVLVPNIVSCL